jgi:hypothetical protein
MRGSSCFQDSVLLCVAYPVRSLAARKNKLLRQVSCFVYDTEQLSSRMGTELLSRPRFQGPRRSSPRSVQICS